ERHQGSPEEEETHRGSPEKRETHRDTCVRPPRCPPQDGLAGLFSGVPLPVSATGRPAEPPNLEPHSDMSTWHSSDWIPYSVLDDEGGALRQQKLDRQKQKKKRQEPLMVQSNVDGRSRTRRAKQSEEQAPLVESYLSSNCSTVYQVQEAEQEGVKTDPQAPCSAKKSAASTPQTGSTPRAGSTPQTGSARKERKGKHKGTEGPAAAAQDEVAELGGQIQILPGGQPAGQEGEGEAVGSVLRQGKQDLRLTMLKKVPPQYRHLPQYHHSTGRLSQYSHFPQYRRSTTASPQFHPSATAPQVCYSSTRIQH
ncbi:hypothetical protein ANANG_G00202240, partial [Anguilla anguilla]